MSHSILSAGLTPAPTADEQRREDERTREAAARFDAILRLPPRAESARRAIRTPPPAGPACSPPAPLEPNAARAEGPDEAPSASEDTMDSAPRPAPRRFDAPIERRGAASRQHAGADDQAPDAGRTTQVTSRGPAPTGASDDHPDEADEATEAFERLAERLTPLCRRTGHSPDSWSVVLPLDPEVLPESELRIHASRDWLRLRFTTQSGASLHLISKHMDALGRRLTETLGPHRHIDVDIE
ncbi:type III secretion HpaP family protein [Ideonella sp. DXS29W]|uniref:Type III secretion HpaP family protein n=1 Tax=Ideonella lacteola TaxID=2984193 RepID=A0ABU9BK89_9BURK